MGSRRGTASFLASQLSYTCQMRGPCSRGDEGLCCPHGGAKGLPCCVDLGQDVCPLLDQVRPLLPHELGVGFELSNPEVRQPLVLVSLAVPHDELLDDGIPTQGWGWG